MIYFASSFTLLYRLVIPRSSLKTKELLNLGGFGGFLGGDRRSLQVSAHAPWTLGFCLRGVVAPAAISLARARAQPFPSVNQSGAALRTF